MANRKKTEADPYAVLRKIEKQLIKADEGLEFPEHVDDILEYLGNIGPLRLDDSQKTWIREGLSGTISLKGAEEVWHSRLDFKLQIYSSLQYFQQDNVE
jgi:hypothetical protein